MCGTFFIPKINDLKQNDNFDVPCLCLRILNVFSIFISFICLKFQELNSCELVVSDNGFIVFIVFIVFVDIVPN